MQSRGVPWYILSARYQVVSPSVLIAPYNDYLSSMTAASRREWADRVAEQLDAVADSLDITWLVVAGGHYRAALRRRAVVVPGGVERLPMGRQPGRVLDCMTTPRRVLVVGVAPSRSAGHRRAFEGSSSGAMLEKLLNLQPGDLGAVADTANLYPEWPGYTKGGHGDRSPPDAVLVAAADNLDLRPYDRAVLCGTDVARAFGVSDEPLSVAYSRGVRALLLPHPSTVSRWWNNPANREAAAVALREFVPECEGRRLL
jgi:hypothetical protein